MKAELIGSSILKNSCFLSKYCLYLVFITKKLFYKNYLRERMEIQWNVVHNSIITKIHWKLLTVQSSDVLGNRFVGITALRDDIHHIIVQIIHIIIDIIVLLFDKTVANRFPDWHQFLLLCSPVIFISVQYFHICLYKVIGFSIIGRIGIWVVTQSRKHRRNTRHIPDYIIGYMSDPFGQRFDINWFNDLICRSLESSNQSLSKCTENQMIWKNQYLDKEIPFLVLTRVSWCRTDSFHGTDKKFNICCNHTLGWSTNCS